MKTCEYCGATEESVATSTTLKLIMGRLITFRGQWCFSCRQKVACCPVKLDGDKLTLLLEEADLSQLAVKGEAG
jgi:hypothetical protein